MEWTYTKFEDMSLEELRGLLAGGQGEKVASVGRSLKRAADKIQEAAETLKLKSDRVAWEGGSAQAFQSWTSDLVTASFQLTDFTRGVGHNIEIAGNKLTETKNSLPEVSPGDVAILKALEDNPTAGGMFDPVTGVTAYDQAKAAVEKPRLDAAAALHTLASTYTTSAEVIGRLPKPQFRPPPDVIRVGKMPSTDMEDIGGAAGVVAAAGVAAASQTSLAGGPSGGGTVTPYTSPANSSAGAWPPPQGVGAPPVVTAGQVTPGTLPPGSNLLGQAPGTSQTQHSGAGQVTGSGPNSSGPTSSVVGRSPVGGLPPTTGQGSGTSGGTKGGPVRGGTTGITGGTGGQVRPGTSGGGRSAGPSGLRTGGVEGGTVRPGQMPGAGEARSATSPRTGVPMGGVGAGGAPGATGSTGRTVAGRPPIGTPGGVVGGSGAVPASRGQFSSGGSGLRTGAGQAPAGSNGSAPGTVGQRSGRPMGGAMGAGAATGSDERARRRQRADYLEEDEETWGGAQSGGAVPPVIG